LSRVFTSAVTTITAVIAGVNLYLLATA